LQTWTEMNKIGARRILRFVFETLQTLCRTQKAVYRFGIQTAAFNCNISGVQRICSRDIKRRMAAKEESRDLEFI